MKLNLEAKNREQKRIKAFLEENASDILAKKSTTACVSKRTAKRC